MNTQIYENALGLLGGDCSSACALESACSAAANELSARLRDDIKVEDIRENFVSAAAVLAVSLFIMLDDCGDWSSFKAGNISVSRRGSGSMRGSASALRTQAETMLGDALKDSGFIFRGVRG